jgi:bifunctional UDP-N-acetylglucosamine pyrophosphorylase/glucosamine-1-phosphate N-acetyltransferase
MKAQEEIIAKLEDSGVQFVSLDGVIISPSAEIERGVIIYGGTVIRGKSKIGADSVIGPNSLIEDSQIGSDCVINSTQIYSSVLENNIKIGPFCHIRPNCVIKSGVKIGDFVEVKNSVIGEDTHASHLTYIGDSDVGARVNFGCGTVTVNYDGIKKARCIIGDDAFIGCNSNLVAPVEIGENAFTAAGSTITKDVPANALAISRAREQAIKENWNKSRKKLSKI